MSERTKGSGDNPIMIIDWDDKTRSFVQGRTVNLEGQSDNLNNTYEYTRIPGVIFPYIRSSRAIIDHALFSKPIRKTLYADQPIQRRDLY